MNLLISHLHAEIIQMVSSSRSSIIVRGRYLIFTRGRSFWKTLRHYLQTSLSLIQRYCAPPIHYSIWPERWGGGLVWGAFRVFLYRGGMYVWRYPLHMYDKRAGVLYKPLLSRFPGEYVAFPPRLLYGNQLLISIIWDRSKVWMSWSPEGPHSNIKNPYGDNYFIL